MTKHFTLILRRPGAALWGRYVRHQCLLCLGGMLSLDEADLARLGTSRQLLSQMRQRLSTGLPRA